MKTHKDLNVWKESTDLVLEIYRLTIKFPKEEMFCLVQQLRRAAISVPSNISEGASRNQKREFVRFLRISVGSLSEIETQTIISGKLNYLNETDQTRILGQTNKIRAQITGLIKCLEKKLQETGDKVTG
jgi:four helix bundle protein